MRKEFVKFLNDESGAAAIEFALVSIFMIFMLLGEIELISYIMVKERINRTADETSQLLGHIANFTTNQMNDRFAAARLISYPQGVDVSAVYCMNWNLLSWTNTRTGTGVAERIDPLRDTIRNGRCGNMAVDYDAVMTPLTDCVGVDTGQSDAIIKSFKNMNQFTTGQYVAVKAQCAYTPIINVSRFIDSKEITSTSFITIRYNIPPP